MGGMFYGGDGGWHAEWIEDKRVCTARTFDRYFQLQAPDGALSASDFADFVDATTKGNGASAVATLRERGVLAALATRLDESVQRLPLEPADRVFGMLVSLGEELSAAPGADGPFNTPFVAAWRAASWYLRRIEDATERARLLGDSMKAARALATPATLISLDLEARAKPDSRHEPLFEDVDLEELKAIWLETMRERAATDAALLDNDRLLSNLYRWRDFGDGLDEPREWVRTVAEDPTRLPSLLTAFMSVGQQSGWGDRVATKTEQFRRETVEDFFDVDVLSRLLKRLDHGSLDAEQVRVLGILERRMDKWRRGESTDDR